jgi:hypothetical protein
MLEITQKTRRRGLMRSHEDLPDLAAIEIPGESGTQEEEREAADAGDEDNL